MTEARFSISATDRTQRAFRSVDQRLNRLTGAARVATRALGAIGITVGAAQIGRFVTNTISLTAALEDQAATAGIGVERIQELSKAFDDLGGIADSVTAGAFRRFNRRLGEAKNGADTHREAMEDLGVTMTMETAPALELAIDRLAAIEDPALRAASASRVFGEDAGPQLAAVLGQGTQAIDTQIARIREQGRVMSGDAVQAAAKLDDQFGELSDTLRTNLRRSLLENTEELENLLAVLESSGFQSAMSGTIGFFTNMAAEAGEATRQVQNLVDLMTLDTSPGALAEGSVLGLIRRSLFAGSESFNPEDREPQEGQSVSGRIERGTAGTINRRDDPAHVDLIAQQQRAIEERLRTHMEQLNEIRDAHDPAGRLWREHEERMEALREIDELVFEDEHERARLIEQIESEHQDRLTQLAREGLLSRERFAEMSYKNQAKTIAGELDAITAGVAQHNKTLFRINQAAGIANAIISTHEGVTKSLAAYPMPLAGVMAAAHLAAGIAQVNAIRSASFNGGGGGSAPSLSGATPAQPVTPVTPVQEDRPQSQELLVRIHGRRDDEEVLDRFIEGLNERLKDGMRLSGIRRV